MVEYKTSLDDILDAMDRYGGSFAQQLAALYRVADVVNRGILEAAFQHFFVKYDELAQAVHDR